jgi:hypothetical protein
LLFVSLDEEQPALLAVPEDLAELGDEVVVLLRTLARELELVAGPAKLHPQGAGIAARRTVGVEPLLHDHDVETTLAQLVSGGPSRDATTDDDHVGDCERSSLHVTTPD